jgi:putative ABC transport system substrate-binding protein
MKFRDLFLLGPLAILIAGGQGAFAQSADKMHRLGILSPGGGSIERIRTLALPELARLGFSEGRNLIVEARAGPMERLPALARDLAVNHPEVIIAVGGAAIRTIKELGDATPIVGAFIGEDPMTSGFATSLAHPGGAVTGIVMLAPELGGKRLDLLRETFPGRRRIAALAVNRERDAPNIMAAQEVADRTGVELLPFYAARPEDYRSIFEAMRRAGANALEIVSAPELFDDVSTLAALAIEAGLPTICEWAEMARSGCLLGYGPDIGELEHRVANYVARIFNGAVPGELPIEGPTRFKFVVNMRTARALGLDIPQMMLIRADEVID